MIEPVSFGIAGSPTTGSVVVLDDNPAHDAPFLEFQVWCTARGLTVDTEWFQVSGFKDDDARFEFKLRWGV